MPATSRAGEPRRSEGGFALYELVLALAILGLIAGIALPQLVRPPGPIEIRNAAQEVAATWRTDRNAALSRRSDVVSQVDLSGRTVRGGSTGRIIRIPRGVDVEFVQSGREFGASGNAIRFLPDGRSSGGALTLSRDGYTYRVSVNWLTANVRVDRVEPQG